MSLKALRIKRISNGYVVTLITTTRGGNDISEEWFDTTLDNVLGELQEELGKKGEEDENDRPNEAQPSNP